MPSMNPFDPEASRLERVEAKLDRVLRELSFITFTVNLNRKLELAMSKELDDLTVEVAADTAVESSAVTLIQGLAQQIKDAGTDPVALKALTDSLTTSSTALAAAVSQNTPVAPDA